MQGRLSAWLVKHGLVHRSLGFDYQGIETLQIKPEDWHSIAVILYVLFLYLINISERYIKEMNECSLKLLLSVFDIETVVDDGVRVDCGF